MYVFISHSSSDASITNTICSELEKQGIECFLSSRDIKGGTVYAEEIIDGIDKSDIFLLLLSKKADESPHVLREVERACSRKIPLLVYKLEDFELSKAMEYFIMAHQWLEKKADIDSDIIVKTLKELDEKSKKTGIAPREVLTPDAAPLKNRKKIPVTTLVLIALIAVLAVCCIVLLVRGKNSGNPVEPVDPVVTEAPVSTEVPAETITEAPAETGTPTVTVTEAPVETGTPAVTVTEAPAETGTPAVTVTEAPAETGTPAATVTEAPAETGTPTATVTEAPAETGTPTATVTEAPAETGAPTATVTEAPAETGTPTLTVTEAPAETGTPTVTVTEAPEPAASSIIPADAALGDRISFGTYLGEPIEWRILHFNTDGSTILIATHILSQKPFDVAESGYFHCIDLEYVSSEKMKEATPEELRQLRGNNSWYDSNIRTWLNSTKEVVKYPDTAPSNPASADGKNGYDSEAGFLFSFTKEELSEMLPYSFTTRDMVTGDVHNCSDRVFLLSEKELDWFEEAEMQILATPTEACLAQDNSHYYDDFSKSLGIDAFYWWLRDADSDDVSGVMLVQNKLTDPMAFSNISSCSGFGIRPAICVK